MRSGGRAVSVAVVVLVVMATAAVVPSAWRSPVAAGPQADALADRLVTVRPDVGPTWLVSEPGSTEDRLLLRTLQGVVNRSEARLWVDGNGAATSRWMDEYQGRGLVTVEGSTDLAGALDRFAGEAAGFVVADLAEPWTVQVAATIAADEGGVVAFPGQVPDLLGRGLVQLDDVRGRWTDAASAYEDTLEARRSGMASASIAVLRASDTSWDFAVQQGMPVVFTRPAHPTWARVWPLLAGTPAGYPVYGYLSDTGEEEAIAVGTLSSEDLVLVPTDTTRNLSFHVAVGKDLDRVRAPASDLSGVTPCTSDTLNVVVAMTDGDNLNVPLNHFTTTANWASPRRGELPIAWSMSPAMAVLAPAAWDAYAGEAGPDDELVAMAGWGYGAPALAPSAEQFYRDSFGLMDELGMTSFWSLGGGLETPVAPGWVQVDEAAGDGVPDAVLVSYGNGVGDQYWSPAGRPAFTSRAVYEEGPADLAGHVADLLAMPAEDRPLVSFLSATNWTNPVGALIDVLAPFEARGVRFLTPAEAAACLPEPPPPEPPAPGERACGPDGPVTSEGLALITGPAEAEITSRSTSFELPTEIEVATSAAVGDRLVHRAVITVDVPGFAAVTLEERVRPVVAAGYGAELAAGVWVEMAFEGLSTSLPLPAGLTPVDGVSVSSTGPAATAAWQGDEVVVSTAPFGEDTRSPGGAFELELTWWTEVEASAEGTTIAHRGGPVTFELDLTIGVLLGEIPLVGTVRAPWACAADDAVLAVTSVPAPPAPESSTTTSTVPASTPTVPPAGSVPSPTSSVPTIASSTTSPSPSSSAPAAVAVATDEVEVEVGAATANGRATPAIAVVVAPRLAG